MEAVERAVAGRVEAAATVSPEPYTLQGIDQRATRAHGGGHDRCGGDDGTLLHVDRRASGKSASIGIVVRAPAVARRVGECIGTVHDVCHTFAPPNPRNPRAALSQVRGRMGTSMMGAERA